MSRGLRRVVRIEVEHRFGVSVHEGFDYITEPANWPAYWPRFVRLDPDSRWREPGDRARLTLRMLARDVELEMTLARLGPYRVVEYTSEQRGLPAARHWRHFDEADGGLAYRIVIEYSPRGRVARSARPDARLPGDHGYRARDLTQPRRPIPRATPSDTWRRLRSARGPTAMKAPTRRPSGGRANVARP